MIQRKEDKKKSGIYVIKNLINNKVYVGKAVDIYRRIKDHVTALNTKNKNENPHLINSWHKHKRENVTDYVAEYITIEYRDELDNKLKDRELFWMKNLNSLDLKFGYNIRFDSESGQNVSSETREKMSKSQKSRYKDESEKVKQSEIMKKIRAEHPEIYEESKEKLAYANRKYRLAKCNKETGEIIKIYDIIKDIIDENPEYYAQAIKGCCQGTKNSYKGFRWHYVELDSDKLVLKGKYKCN